MGVNNVRANISITKSLKKRMQKHKEKPNWSSIASAAFESFLDSDQQENLREENRRLKSAIERMKAIASETANG